VRVIKNGRRGVKSFIRKLRMSHVPGKRGDEVLTKKVWERTHKIASLNQLQTHIENKSSKKWSAVPTYSRPTKALGKRNQI